MFANNFICFEDDGRIVAASLGMAKLLGYNTRRCFLAQTPNVFHLCDSPAHAEEFRKRLEESLQSDYVPLRVRCRDEVKKELLLSIRKHPFSGQESAGMVRYEGFAEEISENNASMMLLLTSERHRQERGEGVPAQPHFRDARHREEVMHDLSEILSCVAAYARLIEGGAREQPELCGLAHEILRAAERGVGMLCRTAMENAPPAPHISFTLRRL